MRIKCYLSKMVLFYYCKTSMSSKQLIFFPLTKLALIIIFPNRFLKIAINLNSLISYKTASKIYFKPWLFLYF